MLPSLPEALAAISGGAGPADWSTSRAWTARPVSCSASTGSSVLARNATFVPRLIGVLLAAVSAVLVMLTCRPPKFPTLDPLALRLYLAADVQRTRLALYDAATDAIVEASQLLQAKARTLRWSLWALLAAVLTFGVAVILPLGR